MTHKQPDETPANMREDLIQEYIRLKRARRNLRIELGIVQDGLEILMYETMTPYEYGVAMDRWKELNEES